MHSTTAKLAPLTSLTLIGLVGITLYRFSYNVMNPQVGLLGHNTTPISFDEYLKVPFFNFSSNVQLNPTNGKFDYRQTSSPNSNNGFTLPAPGLIPIIP